jgi:hypothetical protein
MIDAVGSLFGIIISVKLQKWLNGKKQDPSIKDRQLN